MQSVILATTNQGKAAEFQKLLGQLPLTVKTLKDYPQIGEIVEDGQTFAENALIKARAVAKAAGILTIADDSGLVVDALGGAPGIYSARYAGENKDDNANIAKLLQEMENVPAEERGARFICAIAVVTEDGREFVAEGNCHGEILTKAKGDGGFGYDPVFFVPELNKTFAQLTMTEKNAVSHRGKANQEAVKIIAELLEEK